MSTYNDEKYIQEAVGSILDQTFSDFEFLIANDGSTDKTQKILEAYSNQDKRIKTFHRKSSKGQAFRLNQLIPQAQGKYIARMDADDISLPDRILQQKQYLDKNQDIKLVGTQMYIWNPENNQKYKKQLPLDSYSIRFYSLINCPFSHPTMMWRNGFVEKYPLAKVAQDYQLWSSLIYQSDTANLPTSYLLNRQHPSSKSSKHKTIQRKTALTQSKNNLKLFTKKWKEQDINLLFNFLKHHPNQIASATKGWQLYKTLISEFYTKYPEAKKSTSFKLFLTKYSLSLIYINLQILPYKDKLHFIINLLN